MKSMRKAKNAGSYQRRLGAMSLRALAVFVSVAESRSITRAAAHLALTQPAVSLSLQELEADMGCQLIDRTARPLVLTRAGMVLHRLAVKLLADAEEARHAVRSTDVSALPALSLGLVNSVAHVGAPLITDLQRLAMDLRVHSGLAMELYEGLLSHKFDAVVATEPDELPPTVESRLILEEPHLLVIPAAAEGSWRAQGFSAKAASSPLVRYTSRTYIGRTVERYLRRQGLAAPSRLEFETSSSVLEMVRAGLGWSVVPPLAIAESKVDLASLCLLTLPGTVPLRRLYLLNRQGTLPIAARVSELTSLHLKQLMSQTFSGANGWILKQLSFHNSAA